VLLWKQWDIPEHRAQKICDHFLYKFRQCPENPNIELDRWRTLLWVSALDQEYQDLAGSQLCRNAKYQTRERVGYFWNCNSRLLMSFLKNIFTY
jgi:hypothetical protein